MSDRRYIHIRNWDRFQHPDTTRAKTSAIPWIKSYTGQLADEDYIALGWADRGLLEALRLQYATTRGRGINDSTTSLQRLFGQRVLRVQLDRLNDAGYIEFSASKTLARRLQPASTEVEEEREVEVEQEKTISQSTSTRDVGTNGHTEIREQIKASLAAANDDDIPF